MKKIIRTLILTLILFSSLFIGIFAEDKAIVGTGYEVMIPTNVEVNENNSSFTITSNLNSKYKLDIDINSANDFNLKYSTLDSVAYSLFHNESESPIENNYSFTLNNQEDSASEYTDTFSVSIDGSPIYAETYTDTLTFTFDVTIPEHTLSFDVNGGNEEYEPQIVMEGQILGTLPIPIKDGCTFLGWFNETISKTVPVTENSLMGSSDILLTAHWQINQLEFEDQSGDNYKSDFSKTASHNFDIVGAKNGSGNYSYSIESEKNELSEDTTNFTVSGAGLIRKANTPVGTYTIVIKATDNSTAAFKTATYTVVVNKIQPVFKTYPLAAILTYSGEEQSLLSKSGTTEDGTIQYRLGTEGVWSSNVPTATETGTYAVYYQIIGDSNHTDLTNQTPLAPQINKANNPIVIEKTQSGNIGYSSNAQHKEITRATDAQGTVTYSYLSAKNSAGGSASSYFDFDSEGIKIKAATPVDTYTIRININCAGNSNYYEKIATIVYTLTIEKASVGEKPGSSTSKTYTSSSINNGYETPNGVTMTGNNSGTNVGTYTATYTPDANHKWSDGTSEAVTRTLTITKASGSITAPTAKSLTYTGVAQTLVNAGSSSTGTMQYALGSDAINAPSAGYTSTASTAKNAGTYYVWYYSLGDSNHSDTEKACIPVTIGKATITVKANNKTITYGDAPNNAGVSYSGFMNSEDSSVISGTPTYSYNYTQYGNVGTYAITPVITSLSADNYNFSASNGELTVNQKEVGLSWGTSSWVYDGIAHSISVTATGTVNSDQIFVTLTNNSITNVGSKTVTASSLTGDKASNYKLPTNKTKEISITKAASSWTSAPTAKTGLIYDGSSQQLINAGTASGGTAKYKVGDGTYSTSIPSIKNAGTYTVYYKIEGDNNHNDVAEDSFTVTIAKAQLTVKAKDKAITYGDAPTNDGYTITGFKNSETASVVSGSVSYTYNYSQYDDIGSYNITPVVTGLSANNYSFTGSNGTLTVNKKEVSLTWGTLSWTYNGSAHSVVITVNGTVNSDSISATTTGNSITNVGSSTVTVTGLTGTKAGNYKLPSNTTKTITVTKAAGSITAPTAKSLTYSGSAQTLINAGSSTTGEIQYKLSGGSYGTSLPQGTNAGEYTVYYKVVGDNNHNDVAESSIQVTIARASVGSKPTTSVEKAYTGSEQNNNYTTPTGVNMTGNNKGTNVNTYTATYTPDSNHKWSDDTTGSVSVTLTITKVASTVTAPTANQIVYDGSEHALINAGSATGGTIQYKLGESGSYSTAIPKASAAGTYTVYYKVVGDSNHTDVAESSITAKIYEQVTITFNANGGSVSPTSKTIEKGTQIGDLPEPTKDGYTFNGWYNGDSEITSTSTISSNCILTARYTAKEYTVTFHLNGGEWPPQ